MLVSTFKQEKALVASRGLLLDYEPSDCPLFQALFSAHLLAASVLLLQLGHSICGTTLRLGRPVWVTTGSPNTSTCPAIGIGGASSAVNWVAE